MKNRVRLTIQPKRVVEVEEPELVDLQRQGLVLEVVQEPAQRALSAPVAAAEPAPLSEGAPEAESAPEPARPAPAARGHKSHNGGK